MTERDMMHGRDWRGENLKGHWLSEKFHGCRAFWDGERMWTRSGRIVPLPAHWLAALPAMPLDGEVFAGYGHFSDAVDAVARGRFTTRVHYRVFDSTSDGVWTVRMAAVRAVCDGDLVQPVQHRLCTSSRQALAWMEEIQSLGGEGVIARHPNDVYRAGRTGKILKLKGAPNAAVLLMRA